MNYVVPSLPPDKIQSFGYKCAWIAVHTEDLAAVVNTLPLRDPRPCSWADGIKQAYQLDSGKVFVTPPINDFVLCVSFSLPEFPTGGGPDEISSILERLSRRFDDVQYFFTYRVAEAHAWVRFSQGQRVRAFSFADGEKSWDFGPMTDVEKSIDLEFVYEGNVMTVAEQWSVNPKKLETMGLEVTQGIIGSL